MVVDNAVIRFSTPHLIVYLTTCYPISVVDSRLFAASRVRAYVCVHAYLNYMDVIANIISWMYNLWIKKIMYNLAFGNAYV